MAYQPNIPAATDQLSKSQADIQGNFQALTSVGNGWLLALLLGADPTTLSNQMALYSKAGVISGEPELWIKREAGTAYPASQQVYDMTESGSGFTRFPSGMLIKWGTSSANGDILFTDSTPPYFTAIVYVNFNLGIDNYVAATDPNSAITSTGSITIASGESWSKRVYGSNRTTTGAKNVGFYWMAIGY